MTTETEKLPREFGKYHLIERIASGGMAELYRAKLYGAGGFEKDLAIKKVLPHLSRDETFIQMFMDEAMITVTLNHGNIVSVIDFGELDGDYFLVMEYVDGVDLQNLITKSVEIDEPIPIPIACYIASQICRGLDYAHRKVGPDGQPLEIVHRDVSPQNVLISFEGVVKILDFGIARAASRVTSTQAGIVKGKVAYMSPEQVTGQPADKRSDIFSTGVILYEMLTNQKPFEGETPQETMALITRGIYPKPQKLNKKIDRDLITLLRKTLEKNPKRRYHTAGEFAADLSDYLHRSGFYPDATDLIKMIPKRLPDIRPRTVQPTPIRAIRRGAAPLVTGVLGTIQPPPTPLPVSETHDSNVRWFSTPASQPPPSSAMSDQETISFEMLELPEYNIEPSDSTRPTEPSRPAVKLVSPEPSSETIEPFITPEEPQLVTVPTASPAPSATAEERAEPSQAAAYQGGDDAWIEEKMQEQADASTRGEVSAFPFRWMSKKVLITAAGLVLAAGATVLVLSLPANNQGEINPDSHKNPTVPKAAEPATSLGQTETSVAISHPKEDANSAQAAMDKPKTGQLSPLELGTTEKEPSLVPLSQPANHRRSSKVAEENSGEQPASTKPGKDTPAGHQPASQENIISKKVATASKPPISAKTGILRINSEPFAVVYIGKNKIGPTPQMNIKLPAGSHTLSLRNDALGLSRRVRVRIKAGKVSTVFVELTDNK